MAMDPLTTSMPMYDPRRSLAVHNILHNHNNPQAGNGNNTGSDQKPDSTVPSPPAVGNNSGADLIHSNNKSSSQSSGGGGHTATTGTGNGDTLADLANSEISLDLQGLIDDAHFGADAENLFGDLIDNGQNTKRDYVRLSPVNSLGSSANSSPGNGGNGADPSHDPHSFSNNYRSLAYLPGSVHGASLQNPLQQQQQQQQNPNNQTALPSITTLGNAVFVKQEPEDHHMKRQMQHVAAASAVLAAAGQNNAGYVSSTTHMNGYNLPNRPVNGQPNAGQQASQPNSNASQLAAKFNGISDNHKYTSSTPVGPGGTGNGSVPRMPGAVDKKKRVDRSSDEYRRRRERNNQAVRKSREKTKIRTHDTENRVKILARENERLQKKVELLQEELAVLRSLFSNVGVLPDHIHRELSKHIDNFQQQHNAMACM